MLLAQQEEFARHVATGMMQTEAYLLAYPASKTWKRRTVVERACRLMMEAEVKERVQEMRRQMVEDSKLTLEKHIAELERLKEIALQNGKFEAAINAEVNRGKACGLYVTKTEDVTDPMRRALRRMQPAKLDSVIKALDQVKAIREKAKSAS